MIVVHQLGLQGIAWEEFISRDFFTAPQPLQILFTMQVSLRISLRLLRQSLAVFQCVLPIREVQESYLQQHDEYYLRPGWKGSHYLRQQHEYYLHMAWKGSCLLHQHRYRTEARSLCMMKAPREAKILILF